MSDPPPILSYATPRRDRRRSHVDGADRILGAVQLLVALWVVVELPGKFGLGWSHFSEGPWASRLALYWLEMGAGPLNLFAAIVAVRGAIQPRGQQGRLYRRYVWTALVGFALVAASVAVIDRWPPFVTATPTAPAVNDYRFVLTNDDLRWVWCYLLLSNPILILLAVRPVLRSLDNAWGGRAGDG